MHSLTPTVALATSHAAVCPLRAACNTLHSRARLKLMHTTAVVCFCKPPAAQRPHSCYILAPQPKRWHAAAGCSMLTVSSSQWACRSSDPCTGQQHNQRIGHQPQQSVAPCSPQPGSLLDLTAVGAAAVTAAATVQSSIAGWQAAPATLPAAPAKRQGHPLLLQCCSKLPRTLTAQYTALCCLTGNTCNLQTLCLRPAGLPSCHLLECQPYCIYTG